MTSAEKGDALEIAVEAIEHVILASSPSLHGQAFNVERGKAITIADVPHEIDVFVTVAAAKGYQSTFIFECKNWKDPVDKKEIMVFSGKIAALSAQRGYFVAKEYTRGALAYAKTDPRMEILYASEFDVAKTPPPESFHITQGVSAKPYTFFRVRGASGDYGEPISLDGKRFTIGGEDMLLTEYLDTWTEQLYFDRLQTFYTWGLDEGSYQIAADGQQFFAPGECVLDGKDMEHVRLFVEFGVQIIKPAVISDFEVATRGRVVRLSKVNVRDLVLDVAFVTPHT